MEPRQRAQDWSKKQKTTQQNANVAQTTTTKITDEAWTTRNKALTTQRTTKRALNRTRPKWNNGKAPTTGQTTA